MWLPLSWHNALVLFVDSFLIGCGMALGWWLVHRILRKA